jgi:hypothetical protein
VTSRPTTSPLLVAALGLAIVIGLGGVYLIASRATSPPPPDSESAPLPAPSAPAAASANQPRVPSVPKLAARPPGAIAWEPAASAPPPGQDPVAQVEWSARLNAAAQLRLTPEESARVAKIHATSDRRRAEIEATIDPRPGAPVLAVTKKLRENGNQELEELTAALGPVRARQLRDAEADAFRETWRSTADNPATPSALRAVARRRLVFMPSGKPRDDEGSPAP